jgi:hypothetical protein
MYARVLATDGFEFLIDLRQLWKPPRLIVRRGHLQIEVWLDETDVSFLKASRFSVRDQHLILTLVRVHFNELRSAWNDLKNDARSGRLDRHLLVE